MTANLPPVIAIAGRMGSGKDTAADFLRREHGYVVVGFADALKRFCATAFWLPHEIFWGPSALRNENLPVPITADQIRDACRYLASPVGSPLLEELFDLNKTPKHQLLQELYTSLAPITPIMTPRRLLQFVGTDWGRRLRPDVWLLQVQKAVNAVANGVIYLPHDGPLQKIRTRFAPASVVIPDCRFYNEAAFVREQIKGKVIWVDASERVHPHEMFAHESEPSAQSLQGEIDHVVPNNGTIEEFCAAIKAVAAP